MSFGVITSSIAYSQSSSDSLWTAPTWKVRKLMNIALQAQACDTLVNAQAKLINDGLKYNASQDSLLQHRSIQIATLSSDSRNWEERFNNQVALTTIQKKKKRKWVFISIGIAALGIYTNLP